MNTREQKGLEIAALLPITRSGETYIVPSQTGRGRYRVDANPQSPNCDCPDFKTHRSRCKHIFAVEFTIRRETITDGETMTVTETQTVKVNYSQDWRSYNKAQKAEKELFQTMLRDLCSEVGEPIQTNGRPRLPLGDMLFSAAFKVYSTMSTRRFMSDLRDAHAKGYISALPSANSLFNYFETATLEPLLRNLIMRSSLPLKAIETRFAVDSSGFSTCQYVTWYNAKYGRQVDNHDWIKVHLMTGVLTNVVTSVEITERHANDAPMLPTLVKQTARHFTIDEVSADKGYSSRANHEAIADVGGIPYIAFKSNTTGGVGGLFDQMFHYYSLNREAFLAHYHQRSNVESTFSMIKAKFGSRIRSKSPTAQVNEMLCKILCHNICCVIQSAFEFGIDPTFI